MESGAGTTSPEVHSLEPGVERLEAAAALIVDGDCWVRREHHAADMVIVRDVYLEDCYGVASLPNAPQFVIDVGAHLGAFTRRVRERTAHAQVACIEANPTNLPALRANAGAFAHLFAAACHYEPGELALFSTVFPGSDNTGGSAVARVGSPTFDRLASDGRYRYAGRVEAVRLEAIAAGLSWPRIDLLKLDCEGSEFEILEHCDLSLLRWIVGEQHDEARFAELMAQRFAGWNVRILRAGTPGLFWLWRA
jgi:FkbM family methyltransferase